MSFQWLRDANINYRLIKHDYADVYNISPVAEVKLPFPKTGKNKAEELYGQSIAEFVDVSATQASDIISKTFDGLTSARLQQKMGSILDLYAPTSLVFSEKTWYVCGYSYETQTTESVEFCYHLPSLSRVSEFEIGKDVFGCIGFRESFPPEGGFFPTNFDLDLALDFLPSNVTNRIKWINSRPAIVFNSDTGELVFVTTDEEIGWFVLGINEVYTPGMSPLEFAIEFAEHVTVYGWQTDPAGFYKKRCRTRFNAYSWRHSDTLFSNS